VTNYIIVLSNFGAKQGHMWFAAAFIHCHSGFLRMGHGLH